MAILSKGTTFTSPQQISSTNLNNLVDSATFVAGPSGTTDDSTLEVNGGGRIQAKDLGITASKLSASSVTTTKIADANVTPAKLSTGAPSWDGTGSVSTTATDANIRFTITTTAATTARTPGFSAIGYGNGSSGIVSLGGANGTSASPTATTSGDTIGQIVWSGHNGTSFQQVARLSVVASETHSGSAEGVTVRFSSTVNGATTEAERCRISETGGILIGTSTDVPSAILTIASTTKGLRLPVLTTAQRDAISSPAEGLIIFNTTTNKLNFYTGAAWEAVTSA